MPLATGVGDIRRTVDGLADKAAVGDDGAAVGNDKAAVGDDGAAVGSIDEPRAAIAGFETAAADPEARGLATGDVPSPDSGAA